MTHDDQEILRRIIEDRPPLPPEDEQRHRALVRFYEGRRNKCMFISAMWLLFSLVMIAVGFLLIFSSSETPDMLVGLFVAIAGLESSVLIKLWYWIIDNKISIIKGQKQTQLLILRQSGTPESLSLGPEPVFHAPLDTFWERITPTAMKRVWSAVILVSSTVLGVYLFFTLTGIGFARGTQQKDLWMLTSGGTVEVVSTLTLPPGFGNHKELQFPFENVEVMSVRTGGGEEVPFRKVSSGLYDVDNGQRARVLAVSWRFPFSNLKDEGRFYLTPLISLVPASYYELRIAAAPDSGYSVEGAGEDGTARMFCQGGRPPRKDFGSCGLLFVKN